MKGSLAILIFLVGTVLAHSYSHHSAHLTRRFLNDEKKVRANMHFSDSYVETPKAMKKKHEMVMFGDVRNDTYYWLRDDPHSNPDVLAYLQEENNYTDFIMSSTQQVQDKFFADIMGHIKEDDISTPRRRGLYYYYERYLPGKDSYQFCRRLALNAGEGPSVYDVMQTGPNSPPEHVIVDGNARAQGNKNYSMAGFGVSPNHKLVAFTEDAKGDRNYTSHIVDAESTKLVESLIGLVFAVVWAGNEALLYSTLDPTTRRLNKVWLHKLGKEQSNDLCLYHEKDESFSMYFKTSESKEFVFLGSESTNTSFIFYFDIANPERGFTPLTPRVDGIKTSASHRGYHFFIQRSNELYNSELLSCPVSNVSSTTTILPHRESVIIDDLQLFSNHLVVSERENGLTKLIVFNLPPLEEPFQMLQTAVSIEFMEQVYALFQMDSEFYSGILRFYYTSLRTPGTVFDYDMNTGISVIKKTTTVLGGFDSSNYFTSRKWATSPDGCQIPMSIVYRKDLVKLDGMNPVLLYGDGAFENSQYPFFEPSIISLLDRGFIYVIAHVRGGGEMGKKWSENGKLLKKKNTFFDFIACAEYLIEMKYTTKEKLVIDGASGGMLIGVVINMRPDLFKVAIAEAPFLDVLTTLLNSTTESELKEWGDPRSKDFYDYIKSYSPLDNVVSRRYPSILVRTGLNYYRPYSDSAKFVAKLRDVKIDESLLLLKCDLSVGSAANSGWLTAAYKQDAFKFTFILKALNMVT